MVLTQTMKNCEGMSGIRNRLLRGQGANFQSLKRRGGVPSGAAQVIAGTGLALPEITGIVQFSWEILFLNALGGSAPAAVAPPWSDNSRKGNTTPSQSAGAVRGDRHCPLCKQVLYLLLKT